MLDRFLSMSVFVRAVDEHGFTAAASSLGMSATMVAKHVRALEERVGEKLLLRTTRRQALTDVGRIYYERCRRVLAEADAADACAAELRNTPRGVLKVQAPVTFGTERLAPALALYLRQHPAVDVELSLSDRPVDLIEKGHDVAIRIGPLENARVVAKALRPYEMWLCASPAYLAAHGVPSHAHELAEHECLGFANWRRPNVWRLGHHGQVHEVPVKNRLIANNGQALRAAAVAGLGVVMQPEALLSADVAAGRLVRVLPEHQLAQRPMHIIYPPDRRVSPKVRSFVDFVVAAFG